MDSIPRSHLDLVLINDCCINMTLTCPVTAFLGPDTATKTKSTPPGNVTVG